MTDQTLLEDLAALRDQIRQLQAREAALLLALAARPGTGHRPGWPIRRCAQGRGLHQNRK